ncbi:MAG: ATP synthase F0 subunit C [Tidjanibacter sp.]|nr:ATP synthase F0 subunit C [Tidjanibacter sp.]MBQ2247663.1 ATP synthase F0 subunit C [Tidjanibacter sp.]
MFLFATLLQAVNLGAAVAPLAAALAVLGAAWGIGKIGSNALEAMARQPEAAGSLQTAMIVSAALIEGATLFAIVVCLMAI